ncbi:MAG: diacylglyceryl transferase [Flavipsychrobacter sp.]|jgi:prolipoprotein diacylglyceryltransferase|nr:diacylglyceryl transferase [Flavipsychrobacter sp.]
MYPDFQYLFQSLFGTEMPQWLSIFKTFGFLVALSFLAAAWATAQELKRKETQGLLHPEYVTITVGKAVTKMELLFSAIVGFIIGFKIGGIFSDFAEVSPDPMGYLLSLKGNLLIGLAGAVLIAYSKYAEKKKQQLPEPVTKNVPIYPHERITEIVVIAAVGGLLGAKIFNAFETWDDFIKDPIHNLTSSSGLTFLGGLIMATICFYFYCRKHNIPFKHMCDAAAPGIMLAYGLGRLGCQFSGDGDWGIFNTAYISELDGTLRASTASDAGRITQLIGNEPQTYFPAPGWAPRWLFGMNYPHNVGYEGMHIHGCTGEYCTVLPVSVFPTPIYEAIVCIILFFILWALRKRFTRTLQMFGTYLILVGIERFLVELIRVNYKYDWGFIRPSQAEILSVVLILMGSSLLLFYKEKPKFAENK